MPQTEKDEMLVATLSWFARYYGFLSHTAGTIEYEIGRGSACHENLIVLEFVKELIGEKAVSQDMQKDKEKGSQDNQKEKEASPCCCRAK